MNRVPPPIGKVNMHSSFPVRYAPMPFMPTDSGFVNHSRFAPMPAMSTDSDSNGIGEFTPMPWNLLTTFYNFKRDLDFVLGHILTFPIGYGATDDRMKAIYHNRNPWFSMEF